MANVLQDYFNRMTALNRQRGMTGNMQYGSGLDAAIAEGYFDAYEKNKNQAQANANQQKSLAIQEQSRADTAAYHMGSLELNRIGQEYDREYKQGSLANQLAQINQAGKSSSRSNTLGWVAAGTQLAAAGGKLWYNAAESEKNALAAAARDKAWVEAFERRTAALGGAQPALPAPVDPYQVGSPNEPVYPGTTAYDIGGYQLPNDNINYMIPEFDPIKPSWWDWGSDSFYDWA